PRDRVDPAEPPERRAALDRRRRRHSRIAKADSERERVQDRRLPRLRPGGGRLGARPVRRRVPRRRAAAARVDVRGRLTPQIVGIVLVHNEDVFVENAIRNVAAFCDVIHAVDHVSTDGTWDVLLGLASEYDHLHVQRLTHAGESHRLVEPYAGTPTWVFGVDGDELYDPARLETFRGDLLGGAYDHAFKVASNVVNCTELDREARTATGYPSPPSRSITKLYNFAALESWRGDGAERLHGGTPVFRPGHDETSVDNI